jgi:hypothetical protein
MRVINQDGTIDTPYEQASITFGWKCDLSEYYVYCHILNSTTCIKLATYSTEEKAIKAMSMLREAYDKGVHVEFPKIDKSKIAKDDDLTLFNVETAEKIYPTGYYMPCKVFQFPADDEIEV